MRKPGASDILRDKAGVSKFLSYIEAGNYIGDAASAAGFRPQSIFNLIHKGTKVESGPAYDFRLAIHDAKRKARTSLIVQARVHAKKDSNACFKLLAALDPKRFAPSVKLLVRNELEELYARLEARLSPDEYRRFLEAATGRQLGETTEAVDDEESPEETH